MSRFALFGLAAALCSSLLSCREDSSRAAPSGHVAAAPPAELPGTAGWTHDEVKSLSLQLDVPPNARIWIHGTPPALNIIFPPGERSLVFQVTPRGRGQLFRRMQDRFALAHSTYLFRDADALVVRTPSASPLNPNPCEAFVCAEVNGRDICGDMTDPSQETMMTDEECMQAVGIARSLRAL